MFLDFKVSGPGIEGTARAKRDSQMIFMWGVSTLSQGRCQKRKNRTRFNLILQYLTAKLEPKTKREGMQRNALRSYRLQRFWQDARQVRQIDRACQQSIHSFANSCIRVCG